MFSIELKSFGFIALKTWVTLADGLPCFRRNKTKGFNLDREHQLRLPMF
jgi:hypothetical protein